MDNLLDWDVLLIPIVVVGVILILGLAFWARYKTVGPDEAMIVTGSFLGSKNISEDDSGRKIKIVRGGGAFILPVFQQSEFISLLSHKLDVSTPEVYTEQGVPVIADGVAIIKVGSAVEDVATAAEQFIGKPVESLRGEAQEVLEGHLRAILGTMTVEEVYRNRDRFAQEVQGVAARDLKKMGLQIVSFTIKDVAAFKRDQDTAKAEADQAYHIQEARARQTVVEEQMKVELVRKEREIDLQEKEITVREKQYDAEVKKKAEADRYAVEQAAEADKAKKMREADAVQYSIETQAKATAEQKRLEGQAVADAERAKGTADAEVIRLRGLAEAEAKEKLAEAFQKFGEAAVLDIIVKMLPELAGKIAEPISSIDKLTVVDTGKGEGAARVSNYVTELMATAPEMLKSVSGIDVEQLIKGLTKTKTATPVAVPSSEATKVTPSIIDSIVERSDSTE